MANKIKIDDLSDYLVETMKNYNADVENIVNDECKNIADQIKNDLSNNPNIPVSNAKTKHYKKSFAVKKAGAKDSFNGYVVYNKKWQLTHLLEYGHATRNGGRTRAFPHWDQANRKAQDAVISIKKRLEANK
jgi:hypothetical protein